MSLVKSNKKSKQKKPLIQRGPDIAPSVKFEMTDLPSTKSSISSIEKTTENYNPKPASLKIDTRMRDQINTLSLIGIGDSQKEVLEILINEHIADMLPEQKRKFDIQYQVLEDKTQRKNN